MTTEHEFEYEGQRYVVCKRVTSPGVEAEYSFDQGRSWHDTMVGAFQQARQDGKLMRVGDPTQGNADSMETFVVSLLTHIKELGVGEELVVLRTQHNLAIAKRSVLLAVNASTIEDVDFRMERP